MDVEALGGVWFGDDVEVDVEDGLVGGAAVVLEDVVIGDACGVDDGAAEAWEDAAERGGGVVGEIVEFSGGLFGDEEGVTLAEGVDVKEGEGVVVFVDFVGGDGAVQDFGEDGFGHGGG